MFARNDGSRNDEKARCAPGASVRRNFTRLRRALGFNEGNWPFQVTLGHHEAWAQAVGLSRHEIMSRVAAMSEKVVTEDNSDSGRRSSSTRRRATKLTGDRAINCSVVEHMRHLWFRRQKRRTVSRHIGAVRGGRVHVLSPGFLCTASNELLAYGELQTWTKDSGIFSTDLLFFPIPDSQHCLPSLGPKYRQS